MASWGTSASGCSRSGSSGCRDCPTRPGPSRPSASSGAGSTRRSTGLSGARRAACPTGSPAGSRTLAKRIYRTLGLSGYARIDFRLDANQATYALEAEPESRDRLRRGARRIGGDGRPLLRGAAPADPGPRPPVAPRRRRVATTSRPPVACPPARAESPATSPRSGAWTRSRRTTRRGRSGGRDRGPGKSTLSLVAARRGSGCRAHPLLARHHRVGRHGDGGARARPDGGAAPPAAAGDRCSPGPHGSRRVPARPATGALWCWDIRSTTHASASCRPAAAGGGLGTSGAGRGVHAP